ncbi:hypothetical protein NMY22_g5891 [Coprinellus aureogranulatus]|nr:hypothetical protein NMY22_g5891 [Coprinellus aureogranulatus]
MSAERTSPPPIPRLSSLVYGLGGLGIAFVAYWLVRVLKIFRMNARAIALVDRFEKIGNLDDIAEAIAILQDAIELTPEGHLFMPGLLTNLGNAFIRRFERTGDLSDINEAISLQERAIERTPDGHPDLPHRLSNLGISLTRRFNRTQELPDIDKAISTLQRSVELTPEGYPILPGLLNNVGIAFTSRFERIGDLPDLSQAISAQRDAVRTSRDDDHYRPERRNNLGVSLLRRFERTGDLSDVTEAIATLQRSIQSTPDDHVALHDPLSNLGICLLRRFERSRTISDLDEAISTLKRAIDVTPEDHAFFPGLLNNFGIALQTRFQRTGNLADVIEAIATQRKAVELTPEGHADLPKWLTNLGGSFSFQYESTSDLALITEALAAQRRAVELTSQADPDLPSRLSNLGTSLRRRFQNSGNASDIDESIALKRRAVDCTPEGHASLPRLLNGLADSLYVSSYSRGSRADLDASIQHYKRAALTEFGAPRPRLEAARLWARLCNQHYPDTADVLTAFDTAIDLVAQVAGLERTIRSRHSELQDFTGLSQEACSAACRLGRVDKALEWVEQGRCIVWSQFRNLRSPLDDLRVVNPDLAEEIVDAASRIEEAGMSREHARLSIPLLKKIKLEDQALSHLSLVRQWDRLLQEVRRIPGFERFLTPSTSSTLLRSLPEEGSVVVLNVGDDRSDAIVLSRKADEPLHIPLHDFTSSKAEELHRLLKDVLLEGGLSMRGEEDSLECGLSGRALKPYRKPRDTEEGTLRDILRCLWRDVVNPSVLVLGLSVDPTSGEEPPRIWWCPTRALSFLPIHAAGEYGSPHSDSIHDYAISSYIPSVSALNILVERAPGSVRTVSGLFLTSQPNPPQALRIPGTAREVQSIYKMATKKGVRALLLEGDALTADRCLRHLDDYSSVHLACHALQNRQDPLAKDLQHADLAFLSACQTSTGSENVSDEAVHLAAGMLAVGYRRVVATMWSICDGHAQEVANGFYENLWREQHGESEFPGAFDGSASAVALHHATQNLRRSLDNSEASFLAWTPFVHFGY